MKARYADKVKRLSKYESAQVSRQAVNSAFPAVMAAVLYVLYKRGWHRYRLIKLYDDVCALLAMPPMIHGKSLDDRQVEAYLAEKLGIDWNKIRNAVQIEVE